MLDSADRFSNFLRVYFTKQHNNNKLKPKDISLHKL